MYQTKHANMIKSNNVKFIISNMILFMVVVPSYINGLFLDTLTDSPNIYNQNSQSSCLSVVKNGKLEVTQDYGVYTRKTAIIMTDAENFDMLGHELCIANSFLTKSSGAAGMSFFEVEYEYNPPILVNTALEPVLFRMRIDLPQYVSLYFSLEGSGIQPVLTTFTENEVYNLGEFMIPFTDYTLGLFTNLNGTYLVNKLKYFMLPPENNVDLRISYPKPVRANYLQYRHVVSTPNNDRDMLAVDGNINTTWLVPENTQSNLTVYFPSIKVKKVINLRWKAPPENVELGYFNSLGEYQMIQSWTNQRPIMKVAKKNNPTNNIDNLHLIVNGFAVLSEIDYI